MGGNEMRKHALRRYVVFRIKAMEFFDINAMWQTLQKGQFLPETPVHRTVTDFAAALRTVQLSWMAVFIDKNGMNVIELWKEVFPRHKAEIDQVWGRIAPAWRVLRSFRDRAGFHADKPPAFFRARKDILVQLGRNH